MVRVDLDGVTRAYAETTALDDVSLAVEEGEFFTLVGPSGCGKTTTLRLVAGFEEPSGGTVRIDGEDVAGVPPEDRGIGVVFQNYALFPHMSVAENVAYGLRFADPPGGVGRDERVADLLDLVDLAGMGDRDPDQLSGGQQQRVALARALAPGPRLLLLDEPMSALDARLRERLRVQVKEIQAELGITTIYVTHDQEEALAISDRVAVMNAGRVEQVGEPRTVYRAPATRFVAEFVGDNNVFDGVVEDVSAGGGEVEGVDEEGVGHAEAAGSAYPRQLTVRVGDESFRVAAGGSGDGHLAAGDEVSVCLRPEHLSLDAGENRFTCRVESTEFLGDATRVHADWDGRDVLLRVGGDHRPEGSVEVGFDPGDVHLLDRK